MAKIEYLRCHFCGEVLRDRSREYCPPCNLYLAYRAMPFLLGMLLIGPVAGSLAQPRPLGGPALRSTPLTYDDEAALIWE